MKHFEDTKGVSDRNRIARAVLSQVSHLSLILRNVDDFTKQGEERSRQTEHV